MVLFGGLALVPAARAASRGRIGTIGAGHVGSTLGGLWLKAGYEVKFSAASVAGARSVAQDFSAQGFGDRATAGTPFEAASFGDTVLLAVPYGALPQIGRDLHAVLAGKIVLDATNPYSFRDGAVARDAATRGAGIVTQGFFPGARLVRGFNSEDMSTVRAEAGRPPPRLAIPLAGDDTAAVAAVATLVSAAGCDPVTTGGLATAHLFQPGGPGFEADLDAVALRQRLGLDG
jgi:predicted dinucleotide-binding enzyme